MKKDKFVKAMILLAVITFVLVEVIGLCFGTVIEGSLFAEIAKWVVMGLVLAVLVCGVFYALVATLVSRSEDKDKK